MNKLKLFLASIQGRLIIGITLLNIVLMGLFVYDFIMRERQYLLEQSLSRARDLTTLMATNTSLAILNNDIVALGELVHQVDYLPDVESVILLDKNFRVKASDKSAYFNHMFSDKASLLMQKALLDPSRKVFQRRHEGVVDTMASIQIDGMTIGYARVITSTDEMTAMIRHLWYKGLLYIFLSVLVGGTFVWWIVRILAYRLSLLSDAASQIAEHNYNISLPSFDGKDELSKTGNAFRIMIESIHLKITELQTMLAKITEAEAKERARSEQSERYQNALFEWSQINYDSSQKAIERILEIAAHTLQIERVGVWLFMDEGSAIVCKDVYSLNEKVHQEGMIIKKADYPRYFEALMEGKIINAQDAMHDPRTSEFSEHYLKPQAIFSMMDMPIAHNGEIIGVVCCENVGSLRSWKAEEQEFMLTIANAIILSLEIEKRKQTEDLLSYQAQHDELTHLSNRALFMDRLDHAIQKAKRSDGQVAVLFIDLDHFKGINDSWGHAVGDEVLVAISNEFRTHFREIDTIARLGGDEFTLLIEDVSDVEIVGEIADKLTQIVQQPIEVRNQRFYVTCSIGISIYPMDGDNAYSLLRNADSAMYKAKEEGRNSYQYYTKELTERAFERVALESNLRQAILREEFEVYYQVKMDAKKETIIGMEALIRWNHPELGMISPASFIPLAEETGLIVSLDEWVMKTAMAQMVTWRNNGFNPGRVSLNLTKKQLRQEGFIEKIEHHLKESGCSPEWIELEVTEGDVMRDPEYSIGVLRRIRELGIRLALDDFGTGYSSLAYLKRLPINILKVDQSFIRGIPDDHDDIAIVRSTIALAVSMGMDVIAEGVETSEQKDFLIANGCTNIQGYLYGRPVPAIEMTGKLREVLTQ